MPARNRGHYKRKRPVSRPAESEVEDRSPELEMGLGGSRKKVRWENDAEVSEEPSGSSEEGTIERVRAVPTLSATFWTHICKRFAWQ